MFSLCVSLQHQRATVVHSLLSSEPLARRFGNDFLAPGPVICLSPTTGRSCVKSRPGSVCFAFPANCIRTLASITWPGFMFFPASPPNQKRVLRVPVTVQSPPFPSSEHFVPFLTPSPLCLIPKSCEQMSPFTGSPFFPLVLVRVR